AAPDLDRHEVAGAAPAEELDRERGGARVVGDPDGHAVALAEQVAERQVLPLEVDSLADRAGRRVDDARRPDADAEEGLGPWLDQRVDQLIDDREGRVAIEAGDGSLDDALDLASEVDDRAAEHVLAEVEAD